MAKGTFRVVVVGIKGDQLAHLRRRVAQGVKVDACEPCRALRLRTIRANLVLCTRFMSHKHQWHLESVVSCPVICSLGGIGAWAHAIEQAHGAVGKWSRGKAC